MLISLRYDLSLKFFRQFEKRFIGDGMTYAYRNEIQLPSRRE